MIKRTPYIHPTTDGGHMADNNRTVINPGKGMAATPTIVNPRHAVKPSSNPGIPTTVLNVAPVKGGDAVKNGIIQIEDTPGSILHLNQGDRLMADGGSYVIQKRIGKAKDSGEADVYLCTREGHSYTAKIYRRKMKLKPELTKTLMELDSPFVARLIDVGSIYDRRFEIYPYYPAGNLADEIERGTFSYNELCNNIIPDLTEGMNALHKAGIVHRDIKPSNIMWRSSKKNSVVLIDFGLASVAATSLTVVVSQVGYTQGYAAPEVSTGFYLDDSDYYSLGIVLYELFTGKKPFQNAREAISGVITRPSNMPEDLYNLIRGLTYKDISFRSDLDNPNRRWTFPEVQDWLDGKNPPVPGTTFVVQNGQESDHSFSGRAIPAISFCEKTYTDIDMLCYAMAVNWERGKQLLMRNTLYNHLNSFQNATEDQHLMALCIEDIVSNDAYTPDQKLLRTIHRLSPDKEYIATPFGVYEDIKQLGEAILTRISNDSPQIRTALTTGLLCVLSTTELSDFMRKVHPDDEQILAHVEHAENAAKTAVWSKQSACLAYELGYCLSRKTELDVKLPDGKKINSLEQLKAYLLQFASGDYKDLYSICEYFLDGAHQLKPVVYGWMRLFECDLSDFNK